MAANMLLWFLFGWMLPVVSSKSFSRFFGENLPLSMEKKAVDDMYINCNRAMAKLVTERLFEKENNGKFKSAWDAAETCAEEKMKIKSPEDSDLTKEHMQAICAYTSDFEKFYRTFNKAVITSRCTYGSEFPFHSLHYWLTSAIQILSKDNTECKTTYRRSFHVFKLRPTVFLNNMIRFGTFASSSLRTNLTDFGKRTCFKITTCSGAFLKNYSRHVHEEEVLIPPYEMFRITKVKSSNVKELADCKVVFILRSAGIHSNLNCRLVLNGKNLGDGKNWGIHAEQENEIENKIRILETEI